MQKGQDFLGRNGRPPKEILRRGRRLNHPQTENLFLPFLLRVQFYRGRGIERGESFLSSSYLRLLALGRKEGKN